ncbi:dihydroorotate dehydrogenase [Cypionkella sp.]|uniref:dihydroorotate dehydrogenase n=1 Tax=Cypionkella sp. TaxID=2811411 RepID=UPI002AC8BE12|nr:dihydroorotate dehydrogenase [Cypionkella sp.]
MMDDLDDLFASAARTGVQPSEALMARVLADAARMQDAPERVQLAPARLGWFAGLAALFGGAGSLVGVGSAAVAGLFFGFVQPEGLGSVTDLWAQASVDQVELMPQLDVLLAEE